MTTLHVYTVDLPPAVLKTLDPASLFTPPADPARVELLDTADLAGVGLAAYLTEGHGAAEEQIAADQPRLDGLRGHVVILRGGAGRADPALTLIGSYAEPAAPVRFVPLPDGGAQGILTPPARPPMSQARVSGMVATVALLVMFALVGLMVWMAA